MNSEDTPLVDANGKVWTGRIHLATTLFQGWASFWSPNTQSIRRSDLSRELQAAPQSFAGQLA